MTTVAFEAIRTENPECSAGPSSSYLCSPGRVTFTTVRINEGQGFHDNGTFIAPLDGVYNFEVSVAHQNNADLAMKTTRTKMYSSYGNEQRSVGKTATLKMEKGDGIYVDNQANRNSIRADTTYPMTFKGFKIN